MSSTYSKKETEILVDTYVKNPCLEVVDKLSVELNKPRKSIIAKLCKEGVYVTRGYRTKRGEIPVTKLEMVRAIEDALDIELPGLDKSPKTTIKTLKEAVIEQTSFLEKTLEELRDVSEQVSVLREMSSKKPLQNPKLDIDPITILDGGTSQK